MRRTRRRGKRSVWVMASTLVLAAVAVAMGSAAERVAHWLVDRVGVVRDTLDGATAGRRSRGPHGPSTGIRSRFARRACGCVASTPRGARSAAARAAGSGPAAVPPPVCSSGAHRVAGRRVRGAQPGPLWAHGGIACQIVAVAEPLIASRYWGQGRSSIGGPSRYLRLVVIRPYLRTPTERGRSNPRLLCANIAPDCARLRSDLTTGAFGSLTAPRR